MPKNDNTLEEKTRGRCKDVNIGLIQFPILILVTTSVLAPFVVRPGAPNVASDRSVRVAMPEMLRS